ncbi:protein phosphatase 2C domain-containing protein [Kitasatospora sp. NRRL B-11411]|uniref:protein phosphatase 2C domain-containing protein n=1 Tax=Kitasatospora sp. NRRL B-11411 TaxID=1463822 RepID=UPI0004C40DF2|nr:protein phosphatase 2C domain-containing protein [Kitasatospora sp. NRRL B-11411]
MPLPALTVTTAGRPGHPDTPTEDRAGHWLSPDGRLAVAVVADGVTTTDTTAAPGGAAYADALVANVLDLAQDPGTPLNRALASAIGVTAVQQHLKGPDRPGTTRQATAGLVRVRPGHTEVTVLGDCTVVLLRRDGLPPIVVTDPRLQTITTAMPLRRRQYERLTSGEGAIGDPEDRRLTAEIMGELEERVNQPDGYWVAGALPEAGMRAVTATVETRDVTDILLATDGGARSVDTYRIHTWSQVARICRGGGPASVLDEIFQAGEADRCGRAAPRAKVHDDTTLTHIELPMGYSQC